jgi:hypothetical protein
MLDEIFADEESLYRVISPVESLWDEEKNKPSSGAFKNKEGLSVDRQGNRSQEQAIATLCKKKGEIKCIVSFSYSQCRIIDLHVRYAPEPQNEFHSEIHDSLTKVPISGSKIKKLQDICKVIKV